MIIFSFMYRAGERLAINSRSMMITHSRVSRGSKPSCVCGILYFKLNEIDAINKITKPRII